MKMKLMGTNGEAHSEIELPMQFNEPIRDDLVKKAVLAIQNNNRQAYGAYAEAGKRHSVDVARRRRDWRGSYGHGISRVPRKVLSHRGTQFFWVGAEAPGMRGGRKAHPPKAEKVWAWKMNTSERRKAIRSAISATVKKDLVEKRGHKIPANYPFIIDDSFESIDKTSKLVEALSKLGFDAELSRGEARKVRPGKGKLRGRVHKVKKSLLFVVNETKKLSKAAGNIPGVDVINIRKLNTEALAPGGHVGRATLFSARSVEELKKGLFTNHYEHDMKEQKAQEQVPEKKVQKKAEAKSSKAVQKKKSAKRPTDE